MRVLIIEDEALVAKNLAKVLVAVQPDVEILDICRSVAGSERWLKTHAAPDLIFMDIQLSDGVSFELFDRINMACPVIFCTAYQEYAIRAFKVNSIDYLLKPIDPEALRVALDKYARLQSLRYPTTLPIASLIEAVKGSQPAYQERLLVHHGAGLIPIRVQDTAGFVKEQIIYLYTRHAERYVTDYHTLDEIEEVVNPSLYYRANRQTLIHKHAVVRIKKHYSSKLEVTLEGHPNMLVDISREKATEFKAWMER